MDVIATAGAGHFRAALEVLLQDDGIDAIYLSFITPSFTDTQAIAREIVSASQKRRKPMVCNFMTDLAQERFRTTRRILQEGGVPCYAYPGDAASALGALARYAQLCARPVAAPRVFGDVSASRARAIIAAAQREGHSMLAADEVAGLLECYRIAIVHWAMADGAEDAADCAERIGFPVAVKVDAAAASHKSDVGGVALDLPDAAAVRAAVRGMQERLAGLGPLRFLVQKFLAGGQELIVGAVRSGDLGHMIMFGLGGVHVEVLKDVVFRLGPLSAPEAQAMLASIRGAALLDGVRGRAAVCKPALVELIQRLSMLMTDLPEIEELDLNPVLAFADEVCAVDARVRVGSRSDACDIGEPGLTSRNMEETT